MPRFIWISIIGILATLALAGCLETSGESTTVSEDTTPVTTADKDNGGASQASASHGNGNGHSTKPEGDADPMSGGKVVDTLFTKRSAIQKEMDILRSEPGAPVDKLAEYEQQLKDLEAEVLLLAKEDPQGLKEQLAELAKVDPELAAEWTALAAEVEEEPAAGEVIALKGEPYGGEAKSISELRSQLKEVWEVEFTTTFGSFTVEVYPELAPIHGIRFLELVDGGFYNDMHIQRIAPGWVVQWGEIRDLKAKGLRPGQEPPPLERYQDRADMVVNIKDEPLGFFIEQWTICFAKRGADSCSTQPFINLDDNRMLETAEPDTFTAFAYVTEGREHIERLVEAYLPAMESAQDDMRADYAAKGAPPEIIEQQVRNDLAWGQYVDKYWDPYTMALITEAKIIKRP